MDETMNDDTSGWSDINNISFTSGTASNILTYTTNTSWDFLNNYYTWPKGISDASFEKKYTPKWHINLGYKNQIDIMWN